MTETAPDEGEVTQRLRGHLLDLGSAVKGQRGSQQRQALTARCLCLSAPWQQAKQPKAPHSLLSALALQALRHMCNINRYLLQQAGCLHDAIAALPHH